MKLRQILNEIANDKRFWITPTGEIVWNKVGEHHISSIKRLLPIPNVDITYAIEKGFARGSFELYDDQTYTFNMEFDKINNFTKKAIIKLIKSEKFTEYTIESYTDSITTIFPNKAIAFVNKS